eukprot:72917-Prorocentrum_lima.AAC.1
MQIACRRFFGVGGVRRVTGTTSLVIFLSGVAQVNFEGEVWKIKKDIWSDARVRSLARSSKGQ